MPIKLTDWGLSIPSPYVAPESRAWCLFGTPDSHRDSKFVGEHVRTSIVRKHNGRQFFTSSGSHYVLEGPPSKNFMAALRDAGYDLEKFDAENPMGIFGR